RCRDHRERHCCKAAREGRRIRDEAFDTQQSHGVPSVTVSGPTPLLDFFKRGEVARDVRLLAAQGGLAPRAHEQLAIIVLLVDDPDPAIGRTADETLRRIPAGVLQAFLARSDVSISLREFFGDRGIFPDEIPPIVSPEEEDEPLLDISATDDGFEEEDEDVDRTSVIQQLADMN